MEGAGRKQAIGKVLKGAARGALGVTGAKIELPGIMVGAATVEEVERLFEFAVEQIKELHTYYYFLIPNLPEFPRTQEVLGEEDKKTGTKYGRKTNTIIIFR